MLPPTVNSIHNAREKAISIVCHSSKGGRTGVKGSAVDKVVAFPVIVPLVIFDGNHSDRSSTYSPLLQRGSSGSGQLPLSWEHSAKT